MGASSLRRLTLGSAASQTGPQRNTLAPMLGTVPGSSSGSASPPDTGLDPIDPSMSAGALPAFGPQPPHSEQDLRDPEGGALRPGIPRQQGRGQGGKWASSASTRTATPLWVCSVSPHVSIFLQHTLPVLPLPPQEGSSELTAAPEESTWGHGWVRGRHSAGSRNICSCPQCVAPLGTPTWHGVVE